MIYLTALLLAVVVAPSDAVTRADAAPPQAECTVDLPSPVFIPLGVVPGGLIVDNACQYVYVTNPTLNRIEVLSLATLSREEPIQVGAQPAGLDIDPSGTLLYVANSGGNNLSVVSLVKRVELRKIRMPYHSSQNDRPASVVIASNGKAFYSTVFNGSGFGSRVMELDLATEQSVSLFSTTMGYMRRSHDRSAVLLVSSQNIRLYRTSTGTFTPSRNIQMLDAAPNLTGSLFLTIAGGTGDNNLVLDGALNQVGTVTGGSLTRGAVMDRGGVLAYRSVASRIEFINVVTFLKTGEVTIGDSVTNSGQMAISADGRLVAVATNTGVALARVQ